jgi:hypothetical protein
MANQTNMSARPQALIFAPPGDAGVEVASFQTVDGEALVSNSDINPYSPIDGKPLQVVSKQHSTISRNKLAGMVKVGHCASCENTLFATAHLADDIEVGNKPFHCVFCSAEVQPTVDTSRLIAALAEEYSGDDDVDGGDPEDIGEDAGDPDDTESGVDDDYEDEDEDGGWDGDEGADDDGDDVEDDGDASDGDDEYEDDPADDETPDTANDEVMAAVAALRAKMTELGMDDPNCDTDGEGEDYAEDENCDDGECDEDGDEETDGEGADDSEDGDDGDNYDDEEAAVAALRKEIAHMKGERPVAGKPVDNDAIVAMNDSGRQTIRNRHSGKVDGNAALKSTKALANNLEGDNMSGEDGITPGTNPTEGEENKQLKTPGSTDKAAPNPTTQPVTPGTDENASADEVVDWRTSKVQVVATNEDTFWVFANNEPVAQLIKAQAAEGVRTVWGEPAIVEKTFAAVAKRGLPAEEAKEFGYKPHNFTVTAETSTRNLLRRYREETAAKGEKNLAHATETYRQSVQTAAISILKGMFGEKNALRDTLVASLNRLAVADAGSVIDTAMAGSVEQFMVDIFKKADEIAAKSNEARNELAQIVTAASYQTRVTADGAALAGRLASNTLKVVAGGLSNGNQESANKGGESDRSDRLTNTLRSISRNR